MNINTIQQMCNILERGCVKLIAETGDEYLSFRHIF